VIALRALGAHGARERSRMAGEKADAFARSLSAMNAQWMRAAFELPLVLMRQTWQTWIGLWTAPMRFPPRQRALERHWQRAAARAFDAGLAPVHRTAIANVRRLSRKKKRR
jgi:hypothetical protein